MQLTLNRLLRRLSTNTPRDAFGWVLLVTSLVLVAAVYWGRVQLREIDGFAGILCLPVICLFGLIAVFHTVSLLRYTAKSKKFLPGFVLLGGALLSFFLPLPPTREETLFVSHRTEYEELVKLAEAAQLPTNEECRGDRAFAYPTAFKYLREPSLGTECIIVETSPTLVVEFSPLDFYRPVVYFKDPQRIPDTYGPCYGDGAVLTRLDHSWFICNRDWN